MLTVKWLIRIGRGYNNIHYMEKTSLAALHPLSNIVITKYFSYNPTFNGVYSRHNLPRAKDESNFINLNC